LAFDAAGKPVLLFQEQWSCDFFAQRNPKVELLALPEDNQNGEIQSLVGNF
jgi:peptide subunit release factor RF-3